MQTTQTRNRRKRNVKKKTERRERGGVQKRGRERRSSFFVRRVCFLFFFFFSASSISSQLDLHKILKPQPRRFRLLPPALPPSAPLSTPSRWPSLSPPRAACPRAALVRNETARGSEGGSMRIEKSASFPSPRLPLPLAPLGLCFSCFHPPPPQAHAGSKIDSRLLPPPPPPTPHSLAQVRRPGCPPHCRQGLRQVRKMAESPRVTSRRGGRAIGFFALVVCRRLVLSGFFSGRRLCFPYPVASVSALGARHLPRAYRCRRGSISSPCRLRGAELA